MSPSLSIVQTDAAPKAIGPYSQAIVANGFVFCSGQIPIVPATGEIVQGDIQAQAVCDFTYIMGSHYKHNHDIDPVVGKYETGIVGSGIGYQQSC